MLSNEREFHVIVRQMCQAATHTVICTHKQRRTGCTHSRRRYYIAMHFSSHLTLCLSFFSIRIGNGEQGVSLSSRKKKRDCETRESESWRQLSFPQVTDASVSVRLCIHNECPVLIIILCSRREFNFPRQEKPEKGERNAGNPQMERASFASRANSLSLSLFPRSCDTRDLEREAN